MTEAASQQRSLYKNCHNVIAKNLKATYDVNVRYVHCNSAREKKHPNVEDRMKI